MTKTRQQYRQHGSRYNAGDVALETQAAAKRWETDLETLRLYGYSQSRLDAFLVLKAEHDRLRAARPEAVTAKLDAVKESSETLRETNVWLDRSFSNMRVLSEEHDDVESEIQVLKGRSRDGLDALVGACLAFLKEHKDMLSPDTEPESLIAAGEALLPKLATINPVKAAAKSTAKTDTEELDVLDGRLLEVMGGLNSAGRKAFRYLGELAKASTYKYTYLMGKPSETGKQAGAGGQAPGATPASGG